MTEAQWRQDAQGGWQYLASDGYWYAGAPPIVAPAVGLEAEQRTNRLGPWGLVLSIVFGGLGGIAGVIMGFRARRQIRRSNGTQRGAGWALASIIVGFVMIAATALIVTVTVVQYGRSLGPSQSQLQASIQPDGVKEGVPGVRHVLCAMPSSWTTGATFTCYAYGESGKELAVVDGTVEPNDQRNYHWGEVWVPSQPSG